MKPSAPSVVALAAIALALRPQKTHANGGDALSTQEKDNLCNLNEDLAKYPAFLTTQLTAKMRKATETLEAELKLQIYIQQHEGNKLDGMFPILAALTAQQKTKLGSVENDIKTAATAITETQVLRGRLLEAIEILADMAQQAGSGAGAGCLSASGSAVLQGASALRGCGKATADIRSGSVTAPTKLTTTGYTDLSPTSPGGTKQTSGTAKCGLLHTAANDGALNEQQVSNDATLASGYLILADNSAGYAMPNIAKLDTSDAAAPKNFKEAYRAFKKAAAAGLHTSDQFQPVKLSELKTSQAALRAFKAVVLKDPKKYDPVADDATLNAQMDKTYTDEEKFASDWWNIAQQNSVSKESFGAQGGDDEKLTDIRDVDKLRQILAYYTAKRSEKVSSKIKELEANLKKAQGTTKVITKTMEEICAALKEKVPCNDNPNCKYNDDKKEEPKCELSDKGKKEAAEKEAESKEGNGGKAASTCTGKLQG
uniref:Variant surface glycoprotein 1086 n=1 Tax=Trypanosoma brucei TaxID=5691 RepID=M4SXL1_9TRYP|nr:variant surface glycoprotein 1086 [Trypanosoma brucei]